MIAVDLSTVDKLLLTQVFKLTSLKEMRSFDEACCRESPVRAANVLILNFSYGALFRPIDCSELSLRVKALAAELTEVRVIAHQKLTLGLSPI